jgi:hypothetical protein
MRTEIMVRTGRVGSGIIFPVLNLFQERFSSLEKLTGEEFKLKERHPYQIQQLPHTGT